MSSDDKDVLAALETLSIKKEPTNQTTETKVDDSTISTTETKKEDGSESKLDEKFLSSLKEVDNGAELKSTNWDEDEEESNLLDTYSQIKDDDIIVKLAEIQSDDSSPLFSVNSFEDLGLSEDLKKGVYDMKFKKPSRIQGKALPLLLKNPPTNMIAQSQSGTGKTAAFVLTMLSRVDTSLEEVQTICIANARELANQIMAVLKEMGKYTKVTSTLAVPHALDTGVKSVKDNIIIGTAGTVMNWIDRRTINTRNVKLLVLDEADNLLDGQGVGDTCIRIKNKLPKTIQIALFSATFSDTVYKYATRFCPKANEITLKREELNVQAIRQYYFECKNDNDKYEAISKLYKVLNIGSSIIFVAKRHTADQLAIKMRQDDHELACLHGNMEAEERDRVMDEFRSGKSRVIISTNVISRGIDISDVTLVINYDMPVTRSSHFDPETYLHRVGRTGRFGRKGVSINLIHDGQSRKVMSQIENHLSIKIEKLPSNDWEKLEKILKL